MHGEETASKHLQERMSEQLEYTADVKAATAHLYERVRDVVP